MKKTRLMITMMALCSVYMAATAQTNVSGVITASTAWSLYGEPYIVVGNTLVQEGVTLTIEPGVTVKFENDMALQIDGELIAIGTEDNRITFTSANGNPLPDDWMSITFSNTSTDAVFEAGGNWVGGCILENCIVEYAGAGDYTTGAVTIDNCLPYIHLCIIRNNHASGISANNLPGQLLIRGNTITGNTSPTGGGISAWTGNVIISGNILTNNTAESSYGGGGIFCYANVSEITNNLIAGNTSIGYGAGGGGGGIYIREGNSTITKNIIRDNVLNSLYSEGEGGGILSYLSNTTIRNNEITQNIGGNGGGIFGGNVITGNCICGNLASQRGGAIYMSQDNVVGNSIAYNMAGQGSAIDIYLAESPAEFAYNTVTRNHSIGENPKFAMGISAHPIINFNNFVDNEATYQLYNNNGSLTAHLDAKNNWWGTNSETELQAMIYDWVDDATRGIVDSSPHATTMVTAAPVSPPSGLTMTQGIGQISLTWNANNEQDIAGYKVYWGPTGVYPFVNSTDVGNETSITLTGLSTGDYDATVTAYDSYADTLENNPSTRVNEVQCAGNESWYAKPVSTLGTDPHEMVSVEKVIVFPNPSQGTFRVEVPVDAIGVKIFNFLGQLIREADSNDLKDRTEFVFTLDQAGTYIMQLETRERILSTKVIVY
jgi:hypothetical protein